MSKKVVKKSKKSKENIPLKPEACSGCEILLAVLITAGIISGIAYLFGYFDNDIKVGQCYLNRKYEPLKVTEVYKYSKNAQLTHMAVKESSIFGGYYLSEDPDLLSFGRSFEFVKKNYTEIPCTRFDLDSN